MYSELFDLQATLLKALAHSRRLEIIRLLRDQELCVSDIYEMLDLPQANVSQHLAVLKDARILTTTKKGKQVFYALTNKKIIQATDLIRDVLIEHHRNTAIAQELARAMKDLVPLTHDPVCKMRLSPKTASYTSKHNEQTYYFCASGCLKKFEHNPAHYV